MLLCIDTLDTEMQMIKKELDFCSPLFNVDCILNAGKSNEKRTNDER